MSFGSVLLPVLSCFSNVEIFLLSWHLESLPSLNMAHLPIGLKEGLCDSIQN